MRGTLLGYTSLVLALAPAACDPTSSNEPSTGGGVSGGVASSHSGGVSGGGALNQSGGPSAGGIYPNLMIEPTEAPGSNLTYYCGAVEFYCETEDCIGIVECEGSGPSRVARCRCIAKLPGADGEGGAGGAPDSEGLPPAPKPYPGSGCPVSSDHLAFCPLVPCVRTEPCDYGDVMTCCGRRSEDCGASWQRCSCTQTNGQIECTLEE
jgi:hypothetical protein